MKLSAFDNIVGHDMVQEWCHPRGTNIYGSIGWCVTPNPMWNFSWMRKKVKKKKRVVDHFSRASTTRMKRRRKDIFTAAERRRLRLACALPMYLRKKHNLRSLPRSLIARASRLRVHIRDIYICFLLIIASQSFFFASPPPPHCVVLFCSWSEGDVNE